MARIITWGGGSPEVARGWEPSHVFTTTRVSMLVTWSLLSKAVEAKRSPPGNHAQHCTWPGGRGDESVYVPPREGKESLKVVEEEGMDQGAVLGVPIIHLRSGLFSRSILFIIFCMG